MTATLTYDPYYAGPVKLLDDSTEPAVEVAAEPVDLPEEPQEPVLEVPEGSVASVLKWVGNDLQKAAAALSAEESGQGRKTLIGKLQELIGA